MKKLAALFLASICLISLSACKNGPEEAVLNEPPALTVTQGETIVEALKGTYSWMYQNESGNFSGIQADGEHPLMLKEHMEPLHIAPGSAACLRFETAPNEVQIHCWSEAAWGQYDTESEKLDVREEDGRFVFDLKNGGYVYEVTAKWNHSTYSGTARYSFYTVQSN